MNRRCQRIKLANRIMAQYQTPCLWCAHWRPGKEPNMVNTVLPNSHGMCRECYELAVKQIKEKAKAQKQEVK